MEGAQLGEMFGSLDRDTQLRMSQSLSWLTAKTVGKLMYHCTSVPTYSNM
jgi:hypothetical protein